MNSDMSEQARNEMIEKLESVGTFLVRSNPSQEVLKTLIELLNEPYGLESLRELVEQRLATQAMLGKTIPFSGYSSATWD